LLLELSAQRSHPLATRVQGQHREVQSSRFRADSVPWFDKHNDAIPRPGLPNSVEQNSCNGSMRKKQGRSGRHNR